MEEAEWPIEQDDILNYTLHYFQELYKDSQLDGNNDEDETIRDNFLEYLDVKLSDLQKSKLNFQFTKEEVKQAVFMMGKWKVPGLDGFPAGFYQSYWKIVGNSVIKLVLDCLNNKPPE